MALDAARMAEIDQALTDLARGEKAWASRPLAGRRALLDAVHDLTATHAAEWVAAARTLKQLPADSPLVGEEWMSGPYPLLTSTASLSETMQALEMGRSPIEEAKVSPAPGGRIAIQALPISAYDTLLLNGFSAEVWLQPGIDLPTAKRLAGLAQLDPTVTQGIGAVMGAGNIMSIAPLDVLYELYANNRVAILKLNPLTDPMLPVLQKIFAPLIDLDAVRIVTGGADVGGYLVNHDLVSHVHITGSAVSHDAIVFGVGEEALRRKAENDPVLTKPITSELGGVSPTIVFPGKWSNADLKFQAEHVATHRLHNNGYNCIAAQAVVISSSWAQKDAFLNELRSAMNRAPSRTAYYPGSDSRVKSALDSYPDAEKLGSSGERVLVTGIEPDQDSPLLCTEYFSPVLGIVELDGHDEEFAAKAVSFVNEQCIGTLGANIIAHPATIKKLGSVFDAAIESLRYGTIAINAWTAIGYLASRATWGAFPGHTVNDVQSGIGVVHNAFLLDNVERTIVHGPFRPAPRSIFSGEFTLAPKPPWFVTNKTATLTGERLVEFAKKPRVGALPKIFGSALRG